MKKLLAIIIVGGCIAIGFFFGNKCSRTDPIVVEKTVTDTVTQQVTITQYKPIEKQTIPSVPVVVYLPADTVYQKGDSVRVEIPTETKIYSDSSYEAQISGYKPSLDWIKVYQQTKYITTTNYIEQKIRFSLLGGVEYDFVNRSVVPQLRFNLDFRKVQLNARIGTGYNLDKAQFVSGVTIGVDIPIYRTK